MRTFRTRPAAGRAGFTLVEVLVTLVLIALLIGVVLPAVINQLDRGEPVRVTEDLESVRSATRLFRVDVRRWPGTVEQLVVAPASWSDSTDVLGNDIPPGLIGRWNGPYLEVGALEGDSLLIGVGAYVGPAFDTVIWGGSSFITAYASNLTAAQAGAISEIIDGHSTVTTTDAGGRVRFDATSVLWYLMSPIN